LNSDNAALLKRQENLKIERNKRRRQNYLNKKKFDSDDKRDIKKSYDKKRYTGFSTSQKIKKTQSDRVENLSAKRLQKKRESDRMDNCSPERLQKKRESNRIDNFSPERLQNKRESNRIENFKFKTVSQLWDWDNPCTSCGCIWLQSTNLTSRTRCCMKGRALTTESWFPQLKPIPTFLKDIAIPNVKFFSGQSAYYNNILCIGSTGVDNGKSNGFEKIKGNHAVRLNGKTYHFLGNKGTANIKGGLKYFTYDLLHQVTEHAKSVSSKKNDLQVKTLKILFRGLQRTNVLVKVLQ